MLCPTFIDVTTGLFRDDHVTLGALGDSFYEYLVKQYLLTGKTETRYREDALAALDAIVRRLLRYSSPSRQAYVAEFVEGRTDHRMDELACFAGGMFALAAMEIPDSGHKKEFGKIAEELTTTCYHMWAYQDTGLAPESVDFGGGSDFTNGPAQFLLRPETLESIFYVYRLTKNHTYRDWGWEIFSAMRQHCRVPTGGYTGVANVGLFPVEPDDVMQSFFLAETMKYLYLLFSDDDLLPLHDWVLNTEAHPLRIRKRNPMDVWTAWEDAHGGALPWEAPTLSKMPKVTLTPKAAKKRALNPGYRVVPPPDELAVEEPDPDEEWRQIEAAKNAARQAQEAAASLQYIADQDRERRKQEHEAAEREAEQRRKAEQAATAEPTPEPTPPIDGNATPPPSDAAPADDSAASAQEG